MSLLQKIGISQSQGLVLVLLTLSSPMAGCSNVDRAVATSPVPDDYHLRHPVVLMDSRQVLDVFLDGASDKLDYRQTRDLDAFAADYRVHGEGRIRVQLPQGVVKSSAAQATLASVRQALSAAGIRGDIEVGSYRVANPALASPVRLSFVKLQAKLASHCGDWPDDLGSGSNLNTWDNRSYYNLGCATQQTLAAQLDDPRDLVRPRAEDPSDVAMRTRAIGNIRQGVDPGTNWVVGLPTPIGGVGGTQ